MSQEMKYEYDPNDALWDEAYEWAYVRAAEEGDVDVERDYEIIESWVEEYYNYMKGLK